ncbi:MAG: hypothetical protein EPN93_20500 [Spirochaetes bacterium]|nr:MAG: hypothetical protein EPN93_20500 [Spirochaetota bacterium]
MSRLLSILAGICIILGAAAPVYAAEEAAGEATGAKEKIVNPCADENRFPDAVGLYLDNYFLLGSVGERALKGADINTQYSKFQISIAYRMFLWTGRKDDTGLYFAYTQKSLWDLLNGKKSSPFVESNYSPEGFYRVALAGKTILGIHFTGLQYIQLGLWQHESNGLGDGNGDNSRGWDRGYFEFEYAIVNDHLFLIPRVWATYHVANENSDITGYLGYGQLTLKTESNVAFLGDMYVGLAATGRKGEYKDINKGSIELTFVLSRIKYRYLDHTTKSPLGLFVQFFTGYGETLLQYNRFNRVVRAGAGFPI